MNDHVSLTKTMLFVQYESSFIWVGKRVRVGLDDWGQGGEWRAGSIAGGWLVMRLEGKGTWMSRLRLGACLDEFSASRAENPWQQDSQHLHPVPSCCEAKLLTTEPLCHLLRGERGEEWVFRGRFVRIQTNKTQTLTDKPSDLWWTKIIIGG